MEKYKDIFGKALLDYFRNSIINSEDIDQHEDILTWTDISETDTLPLSYLFRSYDEMPSIEKKALDRSYGNILDVGCGAGSHSLYLQNKGFNVTAIDISQGAVLTSKRRGVDNVQQIDLLNVKDKFDTILLLMNGTGIFQQYDKVENYLNHLKSLLNPNGQVLIDSSDIKYMFDDELEISESKEEYYGELDYYISYKGEREIPMKWLYLDFESLKKCCVQVGLSCEIIMEGDHFDFLAKISIED